MIKVLCTDLDGTLLRSDKTISEYTVNVLREAINSGITLVPVTGRHLGGIPSEIMDLDIKYAITSNGASLYDIKNNCIIRECVLPDETLRSLLPVFEELDIMADIFTCSEAFTDPRNLDILNDVDASDAVKHYIRNSRTITDRIIDFYYSEKPAVEKLTVNFRKTADGYKNRDRLIEILSTYSGLSCVTGGANNIEITSASATKGCCITYLSEMLNIPLSEFAAMGDTENDTSMLTTAGISIAMANADEPLKKISRYITEYDNDNNGAAIEIEKRFLSK